MIYISHIPNIPEKIFCGHILEPIVWLSIVSGDADECRFLSGDSAGDFAAGKLIMRKRRTSSADS